MFNGSITSFDTPDNFLIGITPSGEKKGFTKLIRKYILEHVLMLLDIYNSYAN